MKEIEVKPNIIEKGLKTWGYAEMITGVGLAFILGPEIGLIIFGAGGIKVLLVNREKNRPQKPQKTQ